MHSTTELLIASAGPGITLDSYGCERRYPLACIEEVRLFLTLYSAFCVQNSVIIIVLVVITSRYCYTRVTANVKQQSDYQRTINRIIHGILVLLGYIAVESVTAATVHTGSGAQSGSRLH